MTIFPRIFFSISEWTENVSLWLTTMSKKVSAEL